MNVAQRAGGSRILNVGAAIAVSSVVGYLLLAIVGRTLSTADFGLFMSFWGMLFGLASSLSMIEQEAARQSAGGDEKGHAPIAQVTLAAAALAATVAGITLIPAVSARLYGPGQGLMGLFVLVAAVGFSAQFMVRGLLIGSGQIRSYGGIVIAEAATRLVLLVGIWLTVGITLGTAAGAVTAGAFAWLAWIRPARRITHEVESAVDPAHHSWFGSLRRASGLMLAAALTAAMITGYATMVTAFSGGTPGPEGGSVFAALTVSRVPLLFVAPLQALAVPTIIRWRRDRSNTGQDARKLILQGGLGTLGVAVLGAVAAWFIGPWAVQIGLGDKFVVSSATIAGLVFSACFLGLLQLMSAALIAFGSYKWVTIVWAAATGATALWLFLSPLDIVGSTVVGALVGPLVGVSLAAAVLWRLAALTVDSVPEAR